MERVCWLALIIEQGFFLEDSMGWSERCMGQVKGCCRHFWPRMVQCLTSMRTSVAGKCRLLWSPVRWFCWSWAVLRLNVGLWTSVALPQRERATEMNETFVENSPGNSCAPEKKPWLELINDVGPEHCEPCLLPCCSGPGNWSTSNAKCGRKESLCASGPFQKKSAGR